MKIDITLDANIAGMMEAEILAAEKAVTGGVREVGDWVKTSWRGQVTGAGLGQRLANTIRGLNFPPRGESLGAAALVYARPNKKQRSASAADVIDAFDRGVLIRSVNGFYLAIPTAAAGTKGMGRDRITPGGWEKRHGMRLRFVYRRGRHSLLVADDARFGAGGLARQKRGRRRKDGMLTGAMTIPIFVLIPQVRLKKRLNLEPVARAAEGRLPAAILSRWK
jgi:hypothetical protein